MVPAQTALGVALVVQSEASLQQEGVHWLQVAAQSGDPNAHYALGKLLLIGSPDLAQSYPDARTHFESAASHGDTRAAYYLGVMDQAGYGAPVDHAAAARYFELAAHGGIADAMFLLANAYRAGDGVPRDDVRALRLYESAAEREYPAAIQALANAYHNGELGLPKDEAKSQEQRMELEESIRHPSLPP
jgi:TPR repeat protein